MRCMSMPGRRRIHGKSGSLARRTRSGRTTRLSFTPSRRVPRHVASNGAEVGAGDADLVDGAALAHDDDAVREREDLVEVRADEQHGRAAVARVEDARADLGDGGEVEAEAR